jgi:cystathionine beta-lyase/cystathionine gamma-synthase
MAKMTKAQAKKRLLEGQNKFLKVFVEQHMSQVLRVQDIEAIDKIVKRALTRLQSKP